MPGGKRWGVRVSQERPHLRGEGRGGEGRGGEGRGGEGRGGEGRGGEGRSSSRNKPPIVT